MKPTCNWFPSENTGPLAKEPPAAPSKAPRSCSGFLADLRAREAQLAGLAVEGFATGEPALEGSPR